MVTIKKPVFLGLAMTAGLLLCSCTPPGPQALLEGERLLAQGKFEAAIPVLQKATQIMPTQAQAWNHLGIAYHHAHRSREAVDAYRKAGNLDKNLAVVHYNLGCLFLEPGINRTPEAVNEFLSFTLLQATNADGWQMLGTALGRLRRMDDAEKAFRQALTLNAKSVEAINGLGVVMASRNKYREAANLFQSALQMQADHPATLLNMASLSHHQLANKPVALQYYQRYLTQPVQGQDREKVIAIVHQLESELSPRTQSPPPAVFTNIAIALATNRIPTATNPVPPPSTTPRTATNGTNGAWLPAVENQSASTGSLTTKAAVASSAKNKPANAGEKVMETVKKAATNLAPHQPPTHTPLEQPKAQPSSQPPPANEFQPSTSMLTKAGRSAEVPPAFATPPQSFASAAVPRSNNPVLAPGRYSYLRPAIQSPGDRQAAQTIFDQALVAQQNKNLAGAITGYESAIKLDPTFYEAYFNLGVATFEQNDLPRALFAYENALAINPESANARHNFGLALQKAGHTADAAVEMEEYLRVSPKDNRARLNLATLYLKQLGQPGKAREHYQELLKDDPQHPQAVNIRYWLMQNP